MIRWYACRDVVEVLVGIQYSAVREGPSLYSEKQRAAWIPVAHSPTKLAARLGDARAVVFADGDGDVGFMTLARGGYIDMAFILPQHRGRGVFRKLFDALEQEAKRNGETRLHTHASLMAQPAFRAVGFSVIQHETIKRAGVNLPRAEMEKFLE